MPEKLVFIWGKEGSHEQKITEILDKVACIHETYIYELKEMMTWNSGHSMNGSDEEYLLFASNDYPIRPVHTNHKVALAGHWSMCARSDLSFSMGKRYKTGREIPTEWSLTLSHIFRSFENINIIKDELNHVVRSGGLDGGMLTTCTRIRHLLLHFSGAIQILESQFSRLLHHNDAHN